MKEKIICVECNKEFEKNSWEVKRSLNHFCTRSCANSFNNRKFPKHKPSERVCTLCKCVFVKGKDHKSNFRCLNCRFKARDYSNFTIADYHAKNSVFGKHPSWKNAHIRYHARSKHLDISNKSCANCGYSKHVELAHIKPISSFSEEATLGEVNSKDNLIQLCRNCHWEFDHNLLNLDQILNK